MFSGSPHSTRATISDRPSAKSHQKQPTKRPNANCMWHALVIGDRSIYAAEGPAGETRTSLSTGQVAWAAAVIAIVAIAVAAIRAYVTTQVGRL